MRRYAAAFILLALSCAAPADGPGANVGAWLNSPLYGNDNDMASLRRVTIRSTGDGYRVNIRNQFNFECDLEFNDRGDPSSLSNCQTRDEPSPICNPDMPESDCAVKSGCFQSANETKPACFESWIVKEPAIKLTCHALRTETVCKGKYTLGTTRGFTSDGEFTIARRI